MSNFNKSKNIYPNSVRNRFWFAIIYRCIGTKYIWYHTFPTFHLQLYPTRDLMACIFLRYMNHFDGEVGYNFFSGFIKKKKKTMNVTERGNDEEFMISYGWIHTHIYADVRIVLNVTLTFQNVNVISFELNWYNSKYEFFEIN